MQRIFGASTPLSFLSRARPWRHTKQLAALRAQWFVQMIAMLSCEHSMIPSPDLVDLVALHGRMTSKR